VKEIRLAIMKYMKLLGYEFDEDCGEYGIHSAKEPRFIGEKDRLIINVFRTILDKLEDEFEKYYD
jgi:hypothetical protein